MRGSYILAHDLGTTGDKASLYNAEGHLHHSTFFGYKTQYPAPNWAEQDPNDWWQAVRTTTRQLLTEAQVRPEEIACITFSGQMMGCVAVDRGANPLRSAIIWADQRGVGQAERLAKAIGPERIYQITGHRISAAYSVAKILWIRDQQPEIFHRTHKFLQAKDLIVAHLTGHFVTDYSDAAGMNLYDLKKWDWSSEILEALDIAPELLPELHSSIDVVGEVTSKAAEATGLRAGTPVVIGGGDGPCAATGAGVVAQGRAYNYLGSSSWIGVATPQPLLDPRMRTFTFPHLVPHMFTPTGTMQSAGGSYQWLRDVVCRAEVQAAEELGLSAYELMNAQAEISEPGAKGLLFLPYLLGERSPRWNPKTRGVFVGLTRRHGRAELIRAVLEGISFNLRIILDAFREQGAQVGEMRVIGGGARGRLWRQILADMYGVPILKPKLLEEATSLGAALAGGVGVGLFPDFNVVQNLIEIEEVTHPHPRAQARYEELYPIFELCYQSLLPVYDALAELEGA